MWTRGICQLLFISLVCGGVVKKDAEGGDIFQTILKANHLADAEIEPKDLIEGDIVKTEKIMNAINGNDESEDEDEEGGEGPDIFQEILQANHMGDMKNDEEASPPDLIEGDIRISSAISSIINGNNDEVADAINVKLYGLSNWPTLIPYYFERSSSQKMRNAVYSAIAEYERKTCLRFQEIAQSEGNRYKGHIQFYRGVGCWSWIGKQGTGAQQISLGNGCEYHGIAVHEIMHALGFFHEQSRRDRDKHVRIIFGNIPPGRRSQFKKYDQGAASTLDFPYDTASIMHYGSYAFSANGRKTIELQPGEKGPIGQRKGLSVIDVKQLNTLYCSKEGAKTTSVPKTTSAPKTTNPPETRPPTNKPSGGKCVDQYSDCPKYEVRGECYRGSKSSQKWVKDHCCASCSKGNRCHDFRTDCETNNMRAKCNVGYLKTYMSKYCAKTCGACR